MQAQFMRLCGCRGVLMVLTGLGGRESVQRMLVANGVVSADGSWEAGRGCPAFDSMDAAMVWCEEHFKQACPPLTSFTQFTLPTDVLFTDDRVILIFATGRTTVNAGVPPCALHHERTLVPNDPHA